MRTNLARIRQARGLRQLDVASRSDRLRIGPAERGPRRPIVELGVEQRTKPEKASAYGIGVEIEPKRRIALHASPVRRLEVFPGVPRDVAESLHVFAERLRDDLRSCFDQYCTM